MTNVCQRLGDERSSGKMHSINLSFPDSLPVILILRDSTFWFPKDLITLLGLNLFIAK